MVVALIINTQLGLTTRNTPFNPLRLDSLGMSKTELSFVVQWATTHSSILRRFYYRCRTDALQDEKWLPFKAALETAESVSLSRD